MDTASIINVLNRLLQILCRSLPRYLEDAYPWTGHDDEPIEATLARVAAEQSAMADSVAKTIIEQGGQPDPGQFPLEFTSINDLGIRFLLDKLIECQQHDVAAIGQYVDALSPTPVMKSLAEEALKGAQGHCEIMEEVRANQPALSGK